MMIISSPNCAGCGLTYSTERSDMRVLELASVDPDQWDGNTDNPFDLSKSDLSPDEPQSR